MERAISELHGSNIMQAAAAKEGARSAIICFFVYNNFI
jgi:hypothetical protein